MIVEDGTGEVEGANSYVDVADFKAYWDDRGFDYSSFADALIEQALVRATQYVETRFGRLFIGYRLLGQDQPLSWPRSYAYLYGELLEGLPLLLIQATIEYGRRELQSPFSLMPDPVYDASGKVASGLKVKVGPIEREQKYLAGSEYNLKVFPGVDKLLCDLLIGAQGAVRN
jgi:hypothetical protein